MIQVPHDEREQCGPQEKAVCSLFQDVTVVLNHPQSSKWPHTKSEGYQTTDYEDGYVEKRSCDRRREAPGDQNACQAYISNNSAYKAEGENKKED